MTLPLHRHPVSARSLLVVLATLAAAGMASAQSTPPRPASADLARELGSIFKAFGGDQSAGVAVTVLEAGEVIATHAGGMASVEHRVRFTHDTVVRLPYSESREFLMMAAVLLEKDGRVSLDARVRTYFPELPAWSDPVTVLDLMNHRSGFVDEWATVLLMHNSMANRFDRSQFLRLLSTQPRPEIEPRQGYLYSNSDMGLLKLVLEKAAGVPLSRWMKARLFDPLGMASTRLHDDVLTVVPNLASRYRTGRELRLARPDKSSPGGNYFIATSAADVARWSEALRDERSEVAWATRQLAQRVRLMPGKKGHSIFGRSAEVVGAHELIVHQGVNGFSWLIEIPARGLAIVGVTNDENGIGTELMRVARYLLGSPESRAVPPPFLTEAVPVTEAVLKTYEGVYLWQDLESWESARPIRRTVTALVERGALTLRMLGDVTMLTYVGRDTFYFRDGYGVQVEFSRTSDGRDQMQLRFDDGYPAIRTVRDSATPWRPSNDAITRLSGRYRSQHLDYPWTILPGEGATLILRRPTVADTVLQPDGPLTFRFLMENGHTPGAGFDAWVTFHEGPRGVPTHLTVGFPRLMDHRFDRVH